MTTRDETVLQEGNKPRVIALEEHYWDQEVASHYSGDRHSKQHGRQLTDRLFDLGEGRLRGMDEAGIDVQVLSHGSPGLHRIAPELAVPLARRANDRLHEVVRANPQRFAAFATLGAADAERSADELERTVATLGFKGAMINGYTIVDGRPLYVDDRRFWPIFERAQALDVPIYLHPALPHPAVIEAYYRDYLSDFPSLLTAGWGFTVETATQVVRLLLSGVCEAYPNLRFIVGHMGESIPFSLWRIDSQISRGASRKVPVRDLFCKHFYITTSGNFCTPALLCSMMEMGVDRILFSVDYPYEDNLEGTSWMDNVPLSEEDRNKILHGNAARVLKL